MESNGHSPDGATDLLTSSVPVACITCGGALDMAAKFCPECGTQRVFTADPAASLPSSSAATPFSEDADATATPPGSSAEVDATLPLPTSETLVIEGVEAERPAGCAESAAEDIHEQSDVAVAAPRSHRRWALYGLLGLLIVAAVVAAYHVYGAMQRRPLITALTASSEEFADAVAQVAAAEDLTSLNAVAEELPGWIRPIEDQAEVLRASGSSPLAAAAADVAESQVAYLAALQPLSDLEAADMSEWADISEAIGDATSSVEQAASRLAQVDPAARRDAALSVAPASSSVETVIALTTADNATAEVREVVALVSGAQNLSALRDAGSTASDAAIELQAALATLEDMADADSAVERLAAEASFLGELSSLEELTDTTLSSWAGTSESVAERGDVMVGAMSLPPSERSSLTTDVREMRSNVDELVAAGKRELGQWRRDVEEAQAQRDEQLAALDAYESSYVTHMERYNDLRDSTADFTERIRTQFVTFGEGYDHFYDGIAQREEVRSAMSELSPPDALRSEHLAVVGVIDGAIAAMQAAVDGMADAQFCYYCSYDETLGWRRFQAESDRITDEFGSVTAQWEQAVATERTNLENLELPKKPEL